MTHIISFMFNLLSSGSDFVFRKAANDVIFWVYKKYDTVRIKDLDKLNLVKLAYGARFKT